MPDFAIVYVDQHRRRLQRWPERLVSYEKISVSRSRSRKVASPCLKEGGDLKAHSFGAERFGSHPCSRPKERSRCLFGLTAKDTMRKCRVSKHHQLFDCFPVAPSSGQKYASAGIGANGNLSSSETPFCGTWTLSSWKLPKLAVENQELRLATGYEYYGPRGSSVQLPNRTC